MTLPRRRLMRVGINGGFGGATDHYLGLDLPTYYCSGSESEMQMSLMATQMAPAARWVMV
jgi:hypothetical protein